MKTFQLVAAQQRGTGKAKQVCEAAWTVTGAGTAIHLPFHLQGNVRSWQNGFTPRHYFRHNIRPVHTIKQWQHLNSHSTSIYPFSLHNEFEEEATFLLFFVAGSRQLWGRLEKQRETNVIDIVEYFKKADMCLHSHCAVLVAAGSGWITQVRSLRGQVDFQEKVLPTQDARWDSCFK